MSKQFMPEYTPEQRYQLLKDNAYSTEGRSYYRTITQEDIESKKGQLSSNLILIDGFKDEFAEIKAEYKGKIEPLAAENKLILACIKMRKEQVTGMVFNLANQEEGIMETYDDRGELIDSRPLKPEEKQLKAFPLKAIGEN